MSKQRKMILIAAAVGIISMFLPWFSISVPFLGSQSVSGMHDWGILAFICFLAAGALAFLGNQTTNLSQPNWMAVLVAGGIAALIALISLINPPFGIPAAFGLFAALIAAIGVVAFAFINRSATDSLQGGFDSLKGEMNRRMNTPNTTSTTNTMPTTTTVSHTPTDDPTRPTI